MKTAAIALAAAALGLLVGAGAMRSSAGADTYQVPRTADGTPDLNGIWQAVNTANWDLQGHAASQGKVVALGAAFSVPGGAGVVDGDEIPYQDWALAKKKENAAGMIAGTLLSIFFVPVLFVFMQRTFGRARAVAHRAPRG